LGSSAEIIAWLVMLALLPKYPSPKKFFVAGFLSLAVFGWLLSSTTPAANILVDILPALMLNSCFVIFILVTTAMQSFLDYAKEDNLFSHAYQVKGMLSQSAI